MGNRVCLGNNGTAYGLFVSQHGENVLSTSNAGMQFDSNQATFVPEVVAYGQGSLLARKQSNGSGPGWFDSASPNNWGAKYLYETESDGATSGCNFRVAHNRGFQPLVFVRWCYEDEIYTNPTNYPTGEYGVTTLTPGRMVSSTESFFSQNVGNEPEPQDFYTLANRVAYGLDFEVDSTYLYISSYEAGMEALDSASVPLAGFSQIVKFSGLKIYYSYIITNTPDPGIKL